MEMEERKSPLRSVRPGVVRPERCEAKKKTKRRAGKQGKAAENRGKTTM